MDKYYKIADRYLHALNNSDSEREIHEFLKRHPLLIRNAFNAWAWNHISVLSEFSLADDYRINFLILSADSGQWHASFVELKSPNNKPFTKSGLYSQSLNRGLKQLQDTMVWINQNDNLFRKKLSQYFKKNKIAAKCSNADIHHYAFTEILDYQTCISYKYYIVMGRRNMITPDMQNNRHLVGLDKIELATYDRLINVAESLSNSYKE